jgi:DNA-directed RNA polymerase subunit RPC12/RpoP
MSNRTFACLKCRRTQRKPATLPAFRCPACGSECVRVHWKLHVPAPSRRRKWDAFWKQYLLELRMIEQFRAGIGPDVIELPLLNQRHVRQ